MPPLYRPLEVRKKRASRNAPLRLWVGSPCLYSTSDSKHWYVFFFNCWQTFSFCAFLSLMIMPWVHIILEGMKTGSLSTRVLLILTSYSKTLVWSEQADFCKSSAAYRHHKHSNKCAAVPEQKWHVQKLIAVSKAE